MARIKRPDQLDFKSESFSGLLESEVLYVNRLQRQSIESERLKGQRQDRKERKVYAKWIFFFITAWSASVLTIMVQTGFGNFKFDNSVLITLLTTTTANVLALFVIVANYLFSKKTL